MLLTAVIIFIILVLAHINSGICYNPGSLLAMAATVICYISGKYLSRVSCHSTSPLVSRIQSNYCTIIKMLLTAIILVIAVIIVILVLIHLCLSIYRDPGALMAMIATVILYFTAIYLENIYLAFLVILFLLLGTKLIIVQ